MAEGTEKRENITLTLTQTKFSTTGRIRLKSNVTYHHNKYKVNRRFCRATGQSSLRNFNGGMTEDGKIVVSESERVANKGFVSYGYGKRRGYE